MVQNIGLFIIFNYNHKGAGQIAIAIYDNPVPKFKHLTNEQIQYALEHERHGVTT